MLSVALVEKGIVSADVLNTTAGGLSRRVALSLFEWIDAEYYFEEYEHLACPRAMEVDTADLVMEGTRGLFAGKPPGITYRIRPI